MQDQGKQEATTAEKAGFGILRGVVMAQKMGGQKEEQIQGIGDDNLGALSGPFVQVLAICLPCVGFRTHVTSTSTFRVKDARYVVQNSMPSVVLGRSGEYPSNAHTPDATA